MVKRCFVLLFGRSVRFIVFFVAVLPANGHRFLCFTRIVVDVGVWSFKRV